MMYTTLQLEGAPTAYTSTKPEIHPCIQNKLLTQLYMTFYTYVCGKLQNAPSNECILIHWQHTTAYEVTGNTFDLLSLQALTNSSYCQLTFLAVGLPQLNHNLELELSGKPLFLGTLLIALTKVSPKSRTQLSAQLLWYNSHRIVDTCCSFSSAKS